MSGIIVPVKEGGYAKLKEVQTKERKAEKSALMGVFSEAIANSSAAKFVPPPPKDKYGFLIKPKAARGPGEAFIGRGDPKWLSKIYENYTKYAVKLPDPNAKKKSAAQLQDRLDEMREAERKRETRLARYNPRAAGSNKKTAQASDSYKYNAISKNEFRKAARMPSFPYRGPNGRTLVGDLPPDTYVRHDTSHSVMRKEKHIESLQETPGANKIAKAVQGGNLNEIRNLIVSGICSVHSVSRFGEPLLSIAASHAHPVVVAFLLSQGADRGVLNAQGNTAYEVVEAIIEKLDGHYHVKAAAWKECRALLSTESIFTAAKHGNVTRLKWLLKNKQASVHDQNPYGLTPLHIAAMHSQREAIKYLCSMGADPNVKNTVQQDCYDMTPVLALHRLMDVEKRKRDRDAITKKLARLKESKEFEAKREELRRKKEWTKGTSAAKEIFAKFKQYEAVKSTEIAKIRKLPAPDITYRNKDRFAANFLGGSAEETDAEQDFYLKVWPSPNHAKFRHWFRATFS
eukprot:INCI2274.1.p1 GENE.INCI2274.1~~INCI2274.1.p1  ORF type:complete len:515 (+),score=97.94 INCI2274.1:187-1731(+)